MTPSPDVISAAQAAMSKWKIPASVSIAQYGLESGWGQHMPPNSNNPFGIKARAGDPVSDAVTREVVNGHSVFINAGFRAFASIAEAFDYHAELLATGAPYVAAMAALPNVAAFVAAMARRYATDPNYAKTIMQIINGDGLERYDKLTLQPDP